MSRLFVEVLRVAAKEVETRHTRFALVVEVRIFTWCGNRWESGARMRCFVIKHHYYLSLRLLWENHCCIMINLRKPFGESYLLHGFLATLVRFLC